MLGSFPPARVSAFSSWTAVSAGWGRPGSAALMGAGWRFGKEQLALSFIFHVIFRSPHLSPFSLLLSRANSLTDTLQATLLLLSKTLGSNLVQKGSLLAPPRRPLSCVASHHPVHSYLSAPSPRLFPSRLNSRHTRRRRIAMSFMQPFPARNGALQAGPKTAPPPVRFLSPASQFLPPSLHLSTSFPLLKLFFFRILKIARSSVPTCLSDSSVPSAPRASPRSSRSLGRVILCVEGVDWCLEIGSLTLGLNGGRVFDSILPGLCGQT